MSKIDSPIQKNKQFPDLSFQLLKGENISGRDFNGKCIIINWWSTYCAPCREEMPGLNNLVDKYAENPNVIFLAIAHDKKDKLNSFLAKNEFKYSQAICTKENLEIFGNSYPKHIIVNPNGTVSFYMEGGSAEIYRFIDIEIGKVINK